MGNYEIKEKKILFYGAGTTANVLTEKLSSSWPGIIKGYIDKRGDALKEKNGLPVYSLEDVSKLGDKEGIVIVITTRNVFEHWEIANDLLHVGFSQIIFKPLTVLKGEGSPSLLKISEAHDCFCVKFTIPKDEVPCMLEKESIALQDKGVFYESEQDLKVYLPSSLLFTNKLKEDFPDFLLAESNFITNYIAVDLYQSFQQSNGAQSDVIDRYIQFLCDPFTKYYNTDTSGEWKNLLVNARKQVYDQMCLSLELDFDFFKRNPTTVGFNGNQNLGLIASGKNRVSFLIAKGFHHIPVKISKENYQQFLNFPVLEKIENYMKEKEITTFFAPIPHPYFYQCNYIAKDFPSLCTQRLSHSMAYILLEKYQRFDFSALDILDDMDDCGELSRHFRRLGCEVTHLEENELTRLFDDLFPYRATENKTGHGKLSLLLSGSEENILKKVDEYQPDYLFLLHNQSSDLFHEEYKPYGVREELFTTYWQSQLVSGVLYEKRD